MDNTIDPQNSTLNEDKKKIQDLYTDPNFQGCGLGVTGFYRELERTQQTFGLTLEQVRSVLEELPEYAMSFPSIVTFPRRHLKTVSLGYEVETDLCYLPVTQKQNRYCLIVVDCLSQFLYTRAMANKQADTTAKCFAEILDDNQETLSNLQCVSSDRGSEYMGGFSVFCKKKKIKQLWLTGIKKAFLAENLIRRLKKRLFILMRSKFNRNWDDMLAEATQSINKAFNTALSMSAENANKWQNEPLVHEALEHNIARRDRAMKTKFRRLGRERDFPLNSYVYLNDKRSPIWKESATQRSIIYKIIAKNTDEIPVLYFLEDLQHKRKPGSYYSYELFPALDPNSALGKEQLHGVEKILKTRYDPKTKTKHFFVKWHHYPAR